MTARVVLATNNARKLVELRHVLSDAGLDVVVLGLADLPPYPEPAETERTFEGNALLKARACVEATGLPALADDSGIEVDVLNGCPGVRSARWAGPECDDAANNELLLRQISDVPAGERDARFVCAMALALPDGGEEVVSRDWEGQVALVPAGDNGFGYDPIFVPEGLAVTSAQLAPDAKNAISHRGQAVRAIVPVLAQLVHQGRLT
ncbi:MAG TPA: RdgB/HAM1 family non-canonical purine NTP pyrophosphatase [Propionibacteriaceae bacterium]|nr:RdgB/HAM1 family non-canonical purine NTP pyrophosphatase [Propionibacteriaceae bacterium]